jgi:putative toxin-antitoxin system antitoxin component (TIGR02293 family)
MNDSRQNNQLDSETASVVNEPLAMSYISMSPLNFLKSFISEIATPIYKLTSFEKMELLEQGIKKSDIEQFKIKAQLDYDKLAQALAVTRATLINKKKDEVYSENVSEKIVALSDLYSYGYEVFENVENFNAWLFVPNQALGGKKPFDIMDNQFGRDEIRNLLGRIEYGIYS